MLLLRLIAAAVVARRLARGRHLRAPLSPGAPPVAGTVSVVVPARDEEQRIAGCLGPLRSEPADEVIVVDDESRDATAKVAASFGVRVVAGAPLPEGWAGKAWALDQGLRAASGDWVIFLDADTRPQPGLIRALIDAATPFDLLSAGPRFVCETTGERVLHPSFLASLVLRFGPTDVEGGRVVANGQCMVVRREALLRAGGWARVRSFMTEDVALARALVHEDGWRFRMADAADVLEVRMYDSARETWHGWGRSIIDPEVNPGAWLDVAVLWLTMALPLPRLLLRRGDALDALLLAQRLALLLAFRRAYRPRGPAFWLSPLADVPVAARLTLSVLRPPRTWRGRTYPGAGRGARSGS